MNIRFFFVLLLWPFFIKAKDVTCSYSRYGAKDGLLSTEVYCAIEDKAGYIWFGTDIGFSKFNGYEFTNYTSEEGVTNNVIFNLYEDNKGRIWYMSFVGGIGYIENGKVKPYRYNDKILELTKTKGWVCQLYIDNDETVYFTHSEGESGKIDADGHFKEDKVVDGKIIRPLLGPHNHTYLKFLDASEIEEDVKTKVKIYVKDSVIGTLEIPKFNVLSPIGIIPINEQEAFVHLKGNLVIYISENSYRFRSVERSITTISVDKQGRVWVGYLNAGVEIYRSLEAFFNKEPFLVKVFKGFNVSHILSIKSEGVFLSVENQGVYYVHNPKIENFDFGKRVRDNVTALCALNNKELVYAYESGQIYKITSDNLVSKPIGFIHDVTAIKKIKDQLYISSFYLGDKLKTLKGKPFIPISGRDFNITEDSILIQTHAFSASLKLSNGTVHSVLGKHFFRTVSVDRDNLIWLGGNEGLSTMKDLKWEDATHLLKLKEEKVVVKSITELSDETLVITTSVHGIFFLVRKENDFMTYRIKIKDAVLENCRIDETNKVIWVASNKGVYRLFYTDSFELVSQFCISRNHGLASNEVNAVELVGEYVYAATKNGLSRFRKTDLKINTQPPKFYLTSFQVNGKEYLGQNKHQFKHTKNHIQFSYEALCYNCSGKVNYRYRLKGTEQDWNYTEARIIQYPAIAPGEYEFIVSSANEDGAWSEPHIVAFSIIAPFWKRPLFIVCAICLLILAGFFWYRKKMKQKVLQVKRIKEHEAQKRKIIEAKLVALRAQMNPHFTFNSLNAIQNTILNSNLSEATTYISKFSILLRKILEGSEKMYHSVLEELKILELYIELENLRFSNSIQYTINVDSAINQEFIEIPSMVIQPFVENAILHGLSGKEEGLKRLEIDLTETESEIICVVKDNGVGRVEAESTKKRKGIQRNSQGIKIANERLKLLTSDRNHQDFFIKIVDDYDEMGKASGTTVIIKFNKR